MVLAAAIGTGIFAAMINARPDAADPTPVTFQVERGEPLGRVLRRLSDRGLVVHRRPVAIYAWARGFDKRIHAGTYRFTPGERAGEILDKLVRGDVYKVAVTIPEGYMQREIAGVLAAQVGIDSIAFAGQTAMSLPADAGIEGTVLEGYLFPDTYLIPWGLGPTDIAAVMVGRLTDVFDDASASRVDETGLTRHEVLTLASIIEAEARLTEEMPTISAVYHNRLAIGMRLEADPTVAYAMGGYRGRLFYKHLEIDSPYNTYKNAGLPPGPICSPGAAAIHAALYPDATCQAMYFVARGDGGHIFSTTLQDHLAAVRKVRQVRKSK